MKTITQILTATTLLLSVFLSGCSSTKMAAVKAFDPSGEWSYTVTNTPMGSVSGTLNLMKSGEVWEGKMSSSLGVMPIQSLTIQERTIKVVLSYEGSPIRLDGNFDTDQTLKGSISSDYGSFPLSGSKVN